MRRVTIKQTSLNIDQNAQVSDTTGDAPKYQKFVSKINIIAYKIKTLWGKKSYEKILCIGEALIDMICNWQRQSRWTKEIIFKEGRWCTNQCGCGYSSAGRQVELMTKVGVGSFGKHLVEVMQSFGVSTRWVLQDENYFTTFRIRFPDGKRWTGLYFNRGADGQLSRRK